MPTKETLEEYLQRGGKITKLPPQEAPEDKETVPVVSGGGLMTLAEGSIFYAEIKPKVIKKKKVKINLAALPPSLLKYVPQQEQAEPEEEDEEEDDE